VEISPGPRDAETLRLAELGEFTDEEIAAIAEKANEARLRLAQDGVGITQARAGSSPLPIGPPGPKLEIGTGTQR
jgi:hypothetical protein